MSSNLPHREMHLVQVLTSHRCPLEGGPLPMLLGVPPVKYCKIQKKSWIVVRQKSWERSVRTFTFAFCCCFGSGQTTTVVTTKTTQYVESYPRSKHRKKACSLQITGEGSANGNYAIDIVTVPVVRYHDIPSVCCFFCFLRYKTRRFFWWKEHQHFMQISKATNILFQPWFWRQFLFLFCLSRWRLWNWFVNDVII